MTRLVMAYPERIAAFILARRQLAALEKLHDREKAGLQREYEESFVATLGHRAAFGVLLATPHVPANQEIAALMRRLRLAERPGGNSTAASRCRSLFSHGPFRRGVRNSPPTAPAAGSQCRPQTEDEFA